MAVAMCDLSDPWDDEAMAVAGGRHGNETPKTHVILTTCKLRDAV